MLLLPFLFAYWCIGAGAAANTTYLLEDAEELFEKFIQEYGREYTDIHEKQIRFLVFKNNLERINLLNKDLDEAVHGITKFMDFTVEEFRSKFTGFKNIESTAHSCRVESDIVDVDAPESFDWREHNAVTEVKNQGHCGSCFAFSVAANIEGQQAIYRNQLVSLAPQQILDCGGLDNPCTGGNPLATYQYIIDAGGIEADTSYPYEEVKDDCRFDKNKVTVKLAGCVHYELSSQEQLKKLVFKQGPISVALDGDMVKTYQRGVILRNCKSKHINHAVLIVGYGIDEAERPYWIVKNSWGTDWGDEGYFIIERGDDKPSCGLMVGLLSSSILA